MMRFTRIFAALAAIFVIAVAVAGGTDSALAVEGSANDWQMGFQPANSPIMQDISWFHDDFLLWIITVISVFVLGLLIFVMFRFNARRNPEPSTFTHNTLVEVVWTVVPVLILVVIAIPSFRLLYAEDVIPEHDMTIKAIGHQWYWTYEYPDNGNFYFDSIMVEEEDLDDKSLRLLAVDNQVVVPVDTTIRVVVTADDVLHSWAMPVFGIKMDAVPGRLNETWFRAEKVGTYYGQCSELCGVRHAFMPIAVRVVSKNDFETWVAEAQEQFAKLDAPIIAVAASENR